MNLDSDFNTTNNSTKKGQYDQHEERFPKSTLLLSGTYNGMGSATNKYLELHDANTKATEQTDDSTGTSEDRYGVGSKASPKSDEMIKFLRVQGHRQQHDTKSYGELMNEVFDEAETDAEDDSSEFLALRLHRKLQRAERKLQELKRAQAAKERKQEDEMLEFVFGHQTRNESPFLKSLGPIQRNMIESKTLVGQYRIGKVLGKGHFGSVSLATHRVTGRMYAIKCLEKRKMLTPKLVNNLDKEIRVMRMVRHANIVRCHQVVHAPRHIYLVMSLAAEDLFSYACRYSQHMDAGVCREVAIAVLRGIDYLHAIGVAHMDIKPENILVSKHVFPWDLSRRHVQICDLGLCALAQDPHNPMADISVSWCGTPGFIAPELVLNNHGEGRKADMWSVGVTLMDVSTGLPKGWIESWHSASFDMKLNEMMYGVRYGDNFPDPQVRCLVTQLLRRDPELRLTATEALEHPWFDNEDDYDEGLTCCLGSSRIIDGSKRVDRKLKATV